MLETKLCTLSHFVYADKFQMNRLFVAHAQCTLNLVIVISGDHCTLLSLQFLVTSVLCTYLGTCGVSLVRYVWLSDEYRQLKEVFRTNFVLC